MSRSAHSHPSRAAIGVGAVVGALLLASCSAGQITGTSTQRGSASGAAAGNGNVLVRDAGIEFGPGTVLTGFVYPAGATAALQMRIVNIGADGDRLLSATSPAAASVQVAGQTDLPGGQELVVGSTPSTTPGVRSAQISLIGLREEVRSGLTYELDLVFERAGQISLALPVNNPQTPRESAAE